MREWIWQVLRSTPTIFSVIEFSAGRYFYVKEVVPTHVFITRYGLMRLTNEIAAERGVGHGNVLDIVENHLNTLHGYLKVIVVDEAKKDFLLIGQESDYLDYVIERTVL